MCSDVPVATDHSSRILRVFASLCQVFMKFRYHLFTWRRDRELHLEPVKAAGKARLGGTRWSAYCLVLLIVAALLLSPKKAMALAGYDWYSDIIWTINAVDRRNTQTSYNTFMKLQPVYAAGQAKLDAAAARAALSYQMRNPPQPASARTTVTDLKATLEWNPVYLGGYESRGYHLTISSSPSPNGNVFDGVVNALKYEFTGNNNTTYYWQVRSIFEAESGATPVASFAIKVDTAGPVFVPATFSVTTGQNAMVNFQWGQASDESGVQNYIFQAATDSAFKNIVFGNIVEPGTGSTVGLNTEMLGPGKFYWRLAAADVKQNLSEFVSAGTFSVPTDPTDRVAPSMSKTQIRAFGGDKWFYMDWDPAADVSGIKRYHVQIWEGSAASPTKTLFDFARGLPWFSGQSLPPGNYSARVRAQDRKGNWSSWSPTRKFAIGLPALSGLSTVRLSNNDLAISWRECPSVPAGARYEIQVSSKPDFSAIIGQYSTDRNRFTVAGGINSGSQNAYFLRVRAVHDGMASGPWAGAVFCNVFDFLSVWHGGMEGHRIGISLAASGNWLLAGSETDSSFLFQRYGIQGYNFSKALELPGGPIFGTSAAAQGNSFILGDPLTGDATTSNSGQAVIGQFDSASIQILKSPNPSTDGKFGGRVALWSDWAAVGADGEWLTGARTGRAYAFHRENGAWRLHSEFEGSRTPGSSFGTGVALENEVAWISSPLRRVDFSNIAYGACEVFTLNNGIWSVSQDIPAPPGFLLFGWEVALHGEWAMVGSGGSTLSKNARVCVYRRVGNEWQHFQFLESLDVSAGEKGFGYSIAINGAWAAVSSLEDSTSVPAAGAVYLYFFNGKKWVFANKLTGKTANARWGEALALSDDGVLSVGAPEDSSQRQLAGSVSSHWLPTDWVPADAPSAPVASAIKSAQNLDNSIGFAWSDAVRSGEFMRFEIHLDNHEGFGSPEFVSITEKSMATTHPLPPGYYTYRLRAQRWDGLWTDWSDTGTVRVLDYGPPELSSVTSQTTGDSAAQVNALANPRGLNTTVTLEYGGTTAFGNSESFHVTADKTAGGANLTWDLKNLRPGSTYHFRVVAGNAAGRSVSTNGTFSMPSTPPVIHPGKIEKTSDNSVRVWLLVDTKGFNTTVKIDYGIGSFESSSSLTVSPGSGVKQSAYFDIQGLAADMAYTFRLSASSEQGAAVPIEGQTFSTAPPKPRITPKAVVNIQDRSATLQCLVDPQSVPTTVRFEYGPTNRYGQSVNIPLQSSDWTALQLACATLDGLSPNSIYHYRFVSSNTYGTVLGEDMSFSTMEDESVREFCITGTAIPLGERHIRLTGRVDSSQAGGDLFFEYGETTALGMRVQAQYVQLTPDGSVEISTELSNLRAEAVYFYRVSVANGALVNHGETVSFSTQRYMVSTFAGLAGSSGVADGQGSAARFSFPNDIAIDADDNLFVTSNHAIRKITIDGSCTTYAGLSGNAAYADGLASQARFNQLGGIAVDNSGAIYVADYNNRRVRKISNGGVVSTLPALGSMFHNPVDVTVNSEGVVFASAVNNSVWRVAGDFPTSFAELAGDGYAWSVASGVFRMESGICIDRTDTLVTANVPKAFDALTYSSCYAVRAADDSGVFSVLSGALGITGMVDGAADEARFGWPVGIAPDQDGNLYVCDASNRRIRRVDSNGHVATIAGNGLEGCLDGNGSTATFSWPTGVAVSGNGTLFVADHGNHTIRKIVKLPTNAGPLIVSMFPANMPIEAGSTTANALVSANDREDGVLVPIISAGGYDSTKPGTYTLSFLAADSQGLSATLTQSFRVVDTHAPNLQLPEDVTVRAQSELGAQVFYSVSTNDVSGTPTVVSSRESGSFFSIGTTTVSVTAEDTSGNIARGSFRVTVLPPEGSAARISGGQNIVISGNSASFSIAFDPIPKPFSAVVQYGLTPEMGLEFPISVSSINSGTSLQGNAILNGLKPNSMYYYRIVASNEAGSSMTPSATFQTQSVAPSQKTPEIAMEYPAGVPLVSGGASVDFGLISNGFNGPAKSFLIRNKGTANLTIGGFAIVGEGAADYLVVGPKGGSLVKPGGTISLAVTSAPVASGAKTATLQISTNDPQTPNFEISLTGLAADPSVKCSVGEVISADLFPGIPVIGKIMSVTGLPLGIRYDTTIGKIVGFATKSRNYRYSVAVQGADGTRMTYSFDMSVQPIPAWAIGSFTSLISPPSRSDLPKVGLGGYLNLSATASGAYTGSLRLGSTIFPFKGQIQGETEAERGTEPLESTATIITNSRDRTQDITLDLEFRPADHATFPGLTGNLTFRKGQPDEVVLPIQPGWQHVWNAKTNPAFGNKDRTLNVVLDNTETEGEGPQGDGFATIKLTKAGLATWAATLADGLKTTGSFTASPKEEIPFYAAIPYPSGGAILALLEAGPAGDLVDLREAASPPDFTPRWIKLPTPPTNKTDRLYRDGFDVNLDISGAEHRAPATGHLLFGDPVAPPLALAFDLTGGGLDSCSQLGAQNDALTWAAALQKANKLVVTQTGLPVKVTPTFSATTGLLTGSIALSDVNPLDNKKTARPLTYTGLYIPDLTAPAQSTIRGFFTLPELPDAAGETILNTPIQSGLLQVERFTQ